ncbi:PAS domain S-box protein [Halalkalibaculum sp. DA3122]|uniref:PAS domain S-box protein n=1 Tax=Halalkalibaculum sp. DA3122 TaxID=3373607 RepID=UPI003754E59E
METTSKLLFEENPVPMLFFSGKDRIVEDVNQAFSEQYRERSEIIGRSLHEAANPIPRDLMSEEIGTFAGREYITLYLPDQGSVLVEMLIRRDDSDENSRYLGVIQELFPPMHCENCIDHPLFKSVFDKALDMILVADDNGSFVQVNETACRKLGYDKQELLGMGVMDITHGPARSYGNKKWDDFLQTGVDEGEYVLETSDGDLLHVEYRAVANIRPGQHLSILRDVTPFEKLRSREHLKSQAIELTHSGIAFLDSEFRIQQANRSCLQMWGYKQKVDLRDRSFSELFTDAGKLSDIENLLQEKGEWSGELSARHRDGSDFVVSLTIDAVAGGVDAPLSWVVSMMDRTELRETRQALKTSEARFQRLLESAPDAILIAEENGEIIFCNAKTEELTGYEAEELVGQPVEKLVPEAARVQHMQHRKEYAQNPHKRPMGSGLELEAVRKDGTTFPVDVMLGPLQEENGVSVLAIMRDITRFRQAEQKLKDEQEFTGLLHNITVIANQSNNLRETLEQSIRKICRYMNWPVGHVYLPADDGSGEFYPTDIWHLEQPEKYEAFKRLTMVTRFAPQMGMIGDVIDTGSPQWYMNVHEDPRFVRRLPDVDLQVRACFGLPILVEEKVVGVLEFGSPAVQASDALLVEKMATIGHQLGRVVERRQAGEQLKQSETKFKTLFETNLDAILILGRNRVLDCNSSAEELFGIPEEELIRRPIDEYFPEVQPNGSQSRTNCVKKIRNAFEGTDQFFEWRFERAEGSYFDAEVSLIHMKLDGVPLVQAIIRDITGRKKAERQMQKNMVLFSQLFQNSPVGVIMNNAEGKVININSSFRQMFGYELSELKGKEIDDFIVPEADEEYAGEINELAFEGNAFRTEVTRIDKEGNEVPVLLGAVPVQFKNKTIATFGMYIDISDRKNAENELRKSLREKEVLLKEIHHRVKNNLAVITGLLDLQVDQTVDSKATQKLRNSKSRVHSMALVHEQLYQTELFSSIKFDDYIKDLATTISSTFHDTSTEITFVYEMEPVQLTMNQAVPCGLLLNELLTNSYKHAFTDRNEGEITISLTERKQQVKLVVADNGKGLPEEMREGRTDSLGMTLIHTLTSQLEATLEIANGTGACFTLQFEKEDNE